MGKYQTEQKKVLVGFMKEHPQEQYTAEELSALLEERTPAGGQAPGKSTVYRLVSELSENGTLRRFPKSAGRGWTYQYHHAEGCSEHLHLKCMKCGCLLHLECDAGKELIEHLLNEHGFMIDNEKTVLYGLCDACRRLTIPYVKDKNL